MRIEKCIFVDTPEECRFNDIGRCLAEGSGLITCVMNHLSIIIADDSEEMLLDVWLNELHSRRRVKKLSGIAGRQHA